MAFMDMDYKRKISLIVPVYNVEAYLEGCLNSLTQQEGDIKNEYEIIIVNDGSTDSSLEIINKYDWKGCNHIVISQENKGLSGARNTGLQYANGEYIWFIDSDDVINKNALYTLLKFTQNSIDIINIGYCEVLNGKLSKEYYPIEITEDNKYTVTASCVPAQFHIFRHSFIKENNIIFFEGIYHEDMEFTPRCAYLAKTVFSIQEALYKYQIRKGSIMTTIRPKRAFDYLIVAKSLIEFSFIHGETIKTTPLLDTICMSLNNSMFVISQADKQTQKKWNEAFDNNRWYVHALCNSKSLKYKLEGYLFSILKYDRVKIYQFLSKFKL